MLIPIREAFYVDTIIKILLNNICVYDIIKKVTVQSRGDRH